MDPSQSSLPSSFSGMVVQSPKTHERILRSYRFRTELTFQMFTLLKYLYFIQKSVKLSNALHQLNIENNLYQHLSCPFATTPYLDTPLLRHGPLMLPHKIFQQAPLCNSYSLSFLATTISPIIWTEQSSTNKQLDQHVLCSTFHCFSCFRNTMPQKFHQTPLSQYLSTSFSLLYSDGNTSC